MSNDLENRITPSIDNTLLAPLLLDVGCELLTRVFQRLGVDEATRDRLFDELAALGTQDQMRAAISDGLSDVLGQALKAA